MSFSADTRSFRICVLAYSRILHIVHDVIRQLPDTGVEYIVIEAGLADASPEQSVRDVKYL